MSLPPQALKPLIVVDMDDVLCQTNAAAVKWHNSKYGTNVTLKDFHYFHWWKNPGWGTPSEAMEKACIFYDSLEFLQWATPLPGTANVLKDLKQAGYRLAIITARGSDLLEKTSAWLDKWMPDIFEGIHFTGDMVKVMDDSGKEQLRRLTKGEVCRQLSAALLIDDSVENVLSCATTTSWQIPALLFGGYEWGKRSSPVVTLEDSMSFEERRQHEISLGRSPEWWVEDRIELPQGVWRVNDWAEVLEWIQGTGKNFINVRVA